MLILCFVDRKVDKRPGIKFEAYYGCRKFKFTNFAAQEQRSEILFFC